MFEHTHTHTHKHPSLDKSKKEQLNRVKAVHGATTAHKTPTKHTQFSLGQREKMENFRWAFFRRVKPRKWQQLCKPYPPFHGSMWILLLCGQVKRSMAKLSAKEGATNTCTARRHGQMKTECIPVHQGPISAAGGMADGEGPRNSESARAYNSTTLDIFQNKNFFFFSQNDRTTRQSTDFSDASSSPFLINMTGQKLCSCDQQL